VNELADFAARLVEEGADPVVVVSGELDAASAERLRGVVTQAIGRATGRVVVDLGAVEFIDAAGVGALIAGQHEASRAGCRMVLRTPSPRVRRILELVELGQAFPEDVT